MVYDVFVPMDAIRFAWDALKKNLSFFIVLMIIVAIFYNLPSFVMMALFQHDLPSDMGSMQSVLMIVGPLAILSIIMYLLIELGLIRISLYIRDNKTPEIKDLFNDHKLLINYFIASLIFGLMVASGMIIMSLGGFLIGQNDSSVGFIIVLALIFVVLGIYLFLKYQFYGYLIVDKGLGPIEALKQSSKLTDGALKNILVFWLELSCGIAAILLVLGILIAIPIGILTALISKDLFLYFQAAMDFVSSAINIMIVVPLTKLSIAYVYRVLVEREAKAASPGVLGLDAEAVRAAE
jgi:hypothetical protein